LTEILLDTHAWAWSLIEGSLLSSAARAHIQKASAVLVSPISFYEIAQKVRLGKWSQMAAHVENLPRLLTEQGGAIARLEPEICLVAGVMGWAHRDPFDRLILATALHFELPIVSADPVFDGRAERLW
jgi:PIN domain nuclease of toxin-antitoxin system